MGIWRIKFWEGEWMCLAIQPSLSAFSVWHFIYMTFKAYQPHRQVLLSLSYRGKRCTKMPFSEIAGIVHLSAWPQSPARAQLFMEKPGLPSRDPAQAREGSERHWKQTFLLQGVCASLGGQYYSYIYMLMPSGFTKSFGLLLIKEKRFPQYLWTSLHIVKILSLIVYVKEPK